MDVDTWRANRDQAQAGLLGAQAQLDLAQINLGYTPVAAPFDGRMGRHQIDAGNLVGTGGQDTVLAEINRIDPIYAYFTINERELLADPGAARRRAGPAARTRSWSWARPDDQGYPVPGKLDFAAITLTPGTGTLELRGIFPNPEYRLLPGLFVRIRAPLEETPKAILVPEAVIGHDQAGPYVLTVDKDDAVVRSGIELGQLVGVERVVTKGLDATARVIVDGLQRAVPGRKVTPKEASAVAPTAAG